MMITKRIKIDISEDKALELYNRCNKLKSELYHLSYRHLEINRYNYEVEHNKFYYQYVDNIRKMGVSFSSKYGDYRHYYKGLHYLHSDYKFLTRPGIYWFENVRVFWSYDDKCIYIIPRCPKKFADFWVPRIVKIIEDFKNE